MRIFQILVYISLGLIFVYLAYTATARGDTVRPGVGENRPLAKSQLLAAVPVKPGDMEQIRIPKGELFLGSNDAEKAYGYSIGGKAARKWRWYDIETERRVLVDEFYIDKFPVTQGQYFEFVKATGRRIPYISRDDYQKQGFLVHPYEEVLPFLWKDGKPPAGKRNHPVVLVSIGDAWEYCNWRGSGSPDRLFRLPFEAEWEKAARGVDGRYFPWGNEWNDDYANIGQSGPRSTTPVDKYEKGKSPYGVYDMAGNIFEWTLTQVKPDSDRYVLKSCSWDDLPGICRGAARHARPKGSRHILIGFRCVSHPLTGGSNYGIAVK